MSTYPSRRRHAGPVLGLLCAVAVASGCSSDFISYELPPEPSRYTLEVDTAGGVQTTWEYVSQRAEQDTAPEHQPCVGGLFEFQPAETPCAPEPLIFLRYDLNLALDNTAPALASHPITVTPYYQEQVGTSPEVTDLQAEVSFDGGQTWATVPVDPAGDDTFEVTVTHPAAGETSGVVSLRVSAADSQGNTVVQTIPHAYRLR